jgi:hypothetical protein
LTLHDDTATADISFHATLLTPASDASAFAAIERAFDYCQRRFLPAIPPPADTLSLI